MGKLLTINSSINCAHGGKVKVLEDGGIRLTIEKKRVLIKESIQKQTIEGCKTQPTTSSNPCVNIMQLSGGQAVRLTVNKQRVFIDSVQGTTDGNPVGALVAEAKQDKFTAE